VQNIDFSPKIRQKKSQSFFNLKSIIFSLQKITKVV